jgi:predicted cupin superfamily sugar epimerase
MDKLILRNLKITQGYYAPTVEMKRIVDDRDVSWHSSGSRGLKTAGYFLRHESSPGDFAKVVRSFYLHRRMMRFVRQFLASVDE